MNREIEIAQVDPRRLSKNPWNPNVVDPINQDKIVESLRRFPFFKPVICRELPDGSLEILGGEHRVEAAISLDMNTVPVVNLGPIDDKTAKQVGLLDNGRYGEDDPERMAALLGDLGPAEDLLAILDIDEADMASYFEHMSMSDDDIESLMGGDDERDETIDLSPAVKDLKTHTIVRFKLTVEDAEALAELVAKTKSLQGFTDEDSMTNDGNALMHLLQEVIHG